MKDGKDEARGDEWNDGPPFRRRRNPFRGLMGNDPFDSFFDEPFSMGFEDMDERFAQMRAEMDRLFEDGGVDRSERRLAMEEGGTGGEGRVRRSGPIVYGYRMHVGPDGVPHVQEFGNLRRRGEMGELGTSERLTETESSPRATPSGCATGTCTGGAEVPQKAKGPGSIDAETPMYEVNECGGDLYLVVELPGIQRKDIDLRLDDNVLRMDARGCRKSYTLTIPLPHAVRLDRRKVQYRNGVLEVCLPKQEQKADKGREDGDDRPKRVWQMNPR